MMLIKSKTTTGVSFVLTFLVLLTLISGCSSSESAATLPGSLDDVTPPTLIATVPRDLQDSVINTRTVFQFDFDERLDEESVGAGVKLYANKSRNIFSSIDSDTGSISLEADLRERIVQVEDRLITVRESVVVGEEVDEDGVVTPVSKEVERELLATRVNLSPGGERFSLASTYSVVFDRSVRDISSIESIDPTTNLLARGNFLSGDLGFRFSTPDGELRSASSINTAYQSGANFVGKIEFDSLPSGGLLLWKQFFEETPSNGVSGIFYKTFDYATQDFSPTSDRLDYSGVLDIDTNSIDNNVLDFASDSEGSIACVTWSNQDSNVAPLQQSIMVRCGDGSIWGGRTIISSHLFDTAVESLSLLMLSDESAFVSYLYKGIQYIYKVALSESGASVAVQSTASFGGATVEVQDVAVDISKKTNGAESVLALVAVIDSSASVQERYKLLSNEVIFQGDSISITNSSVESGPSIYSQVSVGVDHFGNGFGGWITGTGNDRRLYTSRFNGRFWQTPIGVVKDGRGPITEGSINVFNDGQAAFYWVQNTGSENQLKVQGAFAVDGGAALARPSPLIVDSSVNDFSSLRFSSDREGNGVLYYGLDNNFFFSVRFLHNKAWSEAWGAPEAVSPNVKMDKFSVSQILEDGRMIFAYVRDDAAYDVLEVRTYSDYE